MVSYKDDLYKLLLVYVMDVPTIPVFTDSFEESFGDTIDIRAVARDAHTEVEGDWGGANDFESERERANRAELEGITLRARVRSLEVVETWFHGIVKHEREARASIKRQLGLVQEELKSLSTGDL
ncbi:hypothetical protein Tco_0340679 [Tanacetum coccineum]